jgi:NAD(P)-dependent dehydrogenase (short-subunit alcohol dehydrogenase family)
LYAARSYGGKVVLITGASRGIGRETALRYARAGASVAIVARTGDALNETKDIIVAAVPGADVFVFTVDVRDIESVRSAVDGVLGHFGKLDILIANAGAITSFTPGECYFLSFLLAYVNFLSILFYQKVLTRKILMRGGTPLRSTSAGSSTLSGNNAK